MNARFATTFRLNGSTRAPARNATRDGDTTATEFASRRLTACAQVISFCATEVRHPVVPL
jgi:hypothetical protein